MAGWGVGWQRIGTQLGGKKQLLCLLRPNGAGKTTTIEMLTGKDRAAVGRISRIVRRLAE